MAAVLLNNNNFVVAQTQTQSQAQSVINTPAPLPLSLQNTDAIGYNETRESYVPFPESAQALLTEETAVITTPLTLELATTITHWKNPVWHLLRGLVHRMRSQNQIIYIRARYHVGDGLRDPAIGCRINNEVISGVTTDIEERAVDTPQCQNQCTNHGRYCAPDLVEWRNPANPKVIVEETLRRLCLDDLYHATDLHHWDYLDAFEQLQCQSQIDVTACSQQALSQVARTDWNAVQECVQLSGGLDDDVVNVRLQEELDRQRNDDNNNNNSNIGGGNQNSADYYPRLTIEGRHYDDQDEEAWTVEHLLESVCRAFPDTVMSPLACQFCDPCYDSRKCLWLLDCDGAPLDVTLLGTTNTYRDTLTNAPLLPTNPPVLIETTNMTPPPIDDTAPPTWFDFEDGQGVVIAEPPLSLPEATPTSPPNNNNNNAEAFYDDDEDDEGSESQNNNISNYDPSSSLNTHAFFFGGILIGLVVGLLPAVWFAQDEKATRRKIAAAQAARAAQAEEGEWTSQRGDGGGRIDCGNGGSINNNGCYRDYDDNDDDLDELGGSCLGDSTRSSSIGLGVSNRPTQQELEELEDVDFEEGGGPGSAANHNNNRKNQKSRLPPRMAFSLHKFIV